jgi:sialate O-acetylesterase
MNHALTLLFHRNRAIIPLVGLALVFLSQETHADDRLRFPGWFTDHMVLQRDKNIHVWGWAKVGDMIQVTLGTEKENATADSKGRWDVFFAPRPAGGPFVLKAESGSEQIEVSDVLIGDVWVIGGQSNMNIAVRDGDEAVEAIKASTDDKLRLIHFPERPEWEPQIDNTAQWEKASPQSVTTFSCVGYHFARILRGEMKDVPIGMIQAAVGSTCAEAWLSRDALGQNQAFARYLKDLDAVEAKYPEVKTSMVEMGTKWNRLRKDHIQAGIDFRAGKLKERPPVNDAPYARALPCLMHNGMIRPLQPFAIRGVIWWQGGSNAKPTEKAFEYRELFPYLIETWRKEWGQGDFPFLFAQEPTLKWDFMEPGWMVVREAQLMTAQKVKNTAIIINSDQRYDKNPELKHFPTKPVVGQRLALAALALAYGKKVAFSGPLYDASRTKVEGAKMRIGFIHAESGLKMRQGKLEDFEIAGDDRKFVKAQATIEGDTVVVWSEAVAHPRAVRYDWDTWTGATLMNQAGLPASPFRTDDWLID